MRSLSLLVGLVLLAGGFAGCLGSEEPAPPVEPQATANDSASTDLENVTVDDGTQEMDVGVGHEPHIHDYWLGKERVTLMDADVTVDQFNAFAFTFFNVFRGNPGVGGAFVQLPEGQIVYEGTGQLEFTATWTEATTSGVGVSYRSAESPDFHEMQPINSGEPLVIAVTPEMTDMPHAKTSKWAFFMAPAQAGGTMYGTVHVKVDVVKMRDISLFPGHPELFNGQHTLTLFTGPAKSTTQNFAMMAAGFATGGGGPGEEAGVAAAKVVPMETMSMTANVTIVNAASNVGTVSDVSFLYKAADSNRWRRAQLLSGDFASGTMQFAWPVEMTQTDSPYADASNWRFDLMVQTDPAGQGWETYGLANAEVDYELEVVAYDALLEGVEPVQDDRDDGDA